jgi:DHA1 family tetracycline resistance protein-like MFS transporter
MPNAEPVTEAPPTDQRRAALLVLFLTVAIDLLGFGIVIPFLPLYAARMHVGAFGIGLVLSIYSMMQLLCAPVLGRISDHVGRRPIIMLGLLGSAASYTIYGFASSFAMLLFSRALHGACAATVSTAQAYVADTTDDSNRAHGMGMIGAAFGLGFVLGPALGGLLGHSSLRTPVFFAAALTFANLIFAAMRLPESHPPDPHARLELAQLAQPIIGLPQQLLGHHLTELFTIAFLATFAMAAFEATFALMVFARFGYGPAGVGGLLAYAGLLQALVQGYLLGKVVKRTGEMRLIRGGMIALAIGFAPMASVSSHAVLFILLAMVAIGYGFASPSVASLISKRTERRLQGEVLGINQSALSLARIFGPIAAGFAYQSFAPPAAYIGAGLVALGALAMTRNAALKTERIREA